MANYNNLKNAIQSVIKANGNNEITGPILQAELLSMITTLGAGYQYMGVAQPSTNPGTPDARVMYLAYLPGTYVNFGGLTVTGFCVLKYDTVWTKEDIPISGGGGADFLTEPDDLTLETVGNTKVLKFANRDTQNGMGYVIVRPNATFDSQVTAANTIYEIRYNFSVNSNFSIPANSILYFNGGRLSGAGQLTFNDTLLLGRVRILNNFTGTIANEYITPEMFGAAGDGITDDTAVFQKLDGRNIRLSNATYIIDYVNFGPETKITGLGIGKSIIQQKETATGDCIFIAGYNSSIVGVSIVGNRELDTVGDNQYRALVKVIGTGNGRVSSFHFRMENVHITNTTWTGLVLIGSSTGDPNVSGHNSWIFHINNIFVTNCNCWCMIDESSDNTFSDISLSYGGLGNLWCRSGSNMYVNMKLDGQGGYLGDYNSYDNGALMVINNWANNLHFVNLDVQSGQYGGIKINNARWLYISGNINNCGIGYGQGDVTRYGAFLFVRNCYNLQFNLTLFKITYQTKYGIYIDKGCQWVYGFLQNVNNFENVNLEPDTCKISDTSQNPYIDEQTIDYVFPKFDITGNIVTCYPVNKYRLDVISIISASESLSQLTLFNYLDNVVQMASATTNVFSNATLAAQFTAKKFRVDFEITTDYSPESRLVQILSGSSVIDAEHPTTNERSFIVELDEPQNITAIRIFASKNATDSQGHTITITSLSVSEIGGSYSVNLGAIYTDAQYHWKTGLLIKNNNVVGQFERTLIYAESGKNILQGNVSTIRVSGAASIENVLNP